MVGLIYPFLVVAVVGFLAVLGIHVAALFGFMYQFGHSLQVLFFVLVVIWLATIWTSYLLTRDFKQKDFWRAALRGCPRWMERIVWILFGYSWVGFFALPLIYGGRMNSPANGTRIMSGVLLAFYAIAASVLYSATHVRAGVA